jgi:hypothetical protein
MKNQLNVRNARQAALFELELKGQISDGMWENTANTSWEMWCDAEAIVNPDNVGRNFHPRKDNFQLNSSDLLSCVGPRMLMYARLGAEFTLDEVRLLDNLFDWDGNFTGAPTYPGPYYDKVRAEVAKLDEAVIEKAKMLCADDSYGMKELRDDLKDLKKCFKTLVAA